MALGSTGQSIGGGAYKGNPYDSRTLKPIVRVGGGGGGGGSSGGGSSGGTVGGPTLPNVTINEKSNEVFIDGQGFSVMPGKMTEFLSSKGFGGSPVYSKQLEVAKKVDTAYKEDTLLREKAGIIRTQLLSDYPTLERSRNVDMIARNLASGKMTDFGGKKYSAPLTPFELATKKQTLVAELEKRNTIMILTNEGGKATGVEYGGQSLTLKEFENTYNAKLLQDPSNGEFFLGSVGKADKERLASISGDVKPITNEELNDVRRSLLRAKIKAVTTGELGIVDALTNTKVQDYLKKEGNWAYDKITSVTTEKLQKYAQIAKEQATQVLNESNFKTGNKKIDITAKSLGYISYFGGSAGAYALNMISGLGNVALGLTFKTNDTLSQIIKASPAIIKNSAFEIYRTINPRGKLGSGTIEDFFGTALTLATIAQTASSFSKYGSSLKNIKMTRQLKKDLPAIRQAVRQSQTLLKKEQLYTQRVFMQDSNKWKTFGKAYQAMKNMNAKHDWFAISNKKASVILQRSVIQNKNVRLTNFMVAKTTTEKILSFFKKYNNGNLKFIERFYDNKKIASYLSKVNAKRAYTFIEIRGAKYVTAIDGRGAVSLLRNRAEIANFVKNAKFGKFSFTGSRVVGGNIDTILNINNKAFIGSEAFSYLANKRTAGITTVKNLNKNSGSNFVKYSGGRKTPFSKTFGQMENLKQVQLPKNIAISKGISGSVVGSQLKAVTKAISKAISKNDIALKTGFRAVVTASGLMFFDKYGKLVSGSDATFASNKSIDRTGGAIRDIVSGNTKQSPFVRVSQGGSQGSRQGGSQRSAQQSQQQQMEKMQQSSGRGGRTNFRFQFEPKTRVPLPSDDKKNKVIIKKILGNKLAPSYRIVIGSGKKVKTLGGRYSPKDAISKGAYTIDRTKERTIRIVPTKQRPNARFKMDYLQKASTKFRNYRIRQGKRVRYSSTRLIEKSKYFNDLEKMRRKRRK